ncbi:hypothetical protein O1611_g8382 [Lasiodiplodia mahajangana]|uniref:Uncharacterized protein n=1 Tax=Lasiodiplodia mahajangana TaxID=1108764 RepID=A0ACC2JCL5_9PEZI|nr:hypothetical protein O1611_g8382 [Lasiodiplodia mahajangana]
MIPPPLRYCQKILCGDVENIQSLLKGIGVHTRLPGPGGLTLLQAAVAQQTATIRTIDFLLAEGADINAPADPNNGGRTALQAACEHGSLEIIRHLLKRGADINAPPAEHEGRTALQAASGRTDRFVAIVEFLFEMGANINAPAAQNGGRTALQAAAEKGSYQIVKYLLEKGININAPRAKFDGRMAFEVSSLESFIILFPILIIYEL